MLRLKAFNLIKVLMVLAVVLVLVFVGSTTPIYAKGKAKTKRKLHQLTPEITQEIVHVTLPIKWPE